MRPRALLFIGFITSLFLITSCKTRPYSVESSFQSKIKFDLEQLDSEGLAGEGDGKRSIPYEFCIPDNPINRQQVMKIDKTVDFQKSPGRSMCTSSQVLCVGHTHQPKARKVLKRLAKLSYVEKIIETYYE